MTATPKLPLPSAVRRKPSIQAVRRAAASLHPIRSEKEYLAALKRAERLFDAEQELDPATEDGALFNALITLIEAYEGEHHLVSSPGAGGGHSFPLE